MDETQVNDLPSASEGYVDNPEAAAPEEFNYEEEQTPQDPSDKLTPDHKRFKKVYAQLKQKEREVAEKEQMFATLANQNEQLAKMVSTFQNAVESSTKVDPIAAIDAQISEVKKAIREARNEMAPQNVIDELQDRQIDLIAEKKFVAREASRPKETAEAPAVDPRLIVDRVNLERIVEENMDFLSRGNNKAALIGLATFMEKDPKHKGKTKSQLTAMAINHLKKTSATGVPYTETPSGIGSSTPKQLTALEKKVAVEMLGDRFKTPQEAMAAYAKQKELIRRRDDA